MPDVDSDGIADLLVGAPGGCGPFVQEGVALVLSGLTGLELCRVRAGGSLNRFGSSVAALSDITGDSIPDFVVGAPGESVSGVVNSGAIYFFSGTNCSLIYARQGADGSRLGSALAGIGDVDGDSFIDVAVGAPGFGDSLGAAMGEIRVYSGIDGTSLYRLRGTVRGEEFGSALSAYTDLDGDGVLDFLVGAPVETGGSFSIVSGATGQVVRRVSAPPQAGAFGASLSSVVDLDGDGTQDITVGAPATSVSGIRNGSVHFFSGTTGALIGQRLGDRLSSLGYDVADGTGLLGNATAVGIGGAPGTLMGGAVYGFTVQGDSLLFEVAGTAPDSYLGSMTSRLGDLNRDGSPDLLVGAPGALGAAGGESRGQAYVYSFVDTVPSRIANSPQISTLSLVGPGDLHVALEPVGEAYSNSELIPETVVLRPASGRLVEIHAKFVVPGEDSDGNGAAEVIASFSKKSLRDVFGSTTSTLSAQQLAIEGDLLNGKRFSAHTLISFQSGVPRRILLTPSPQVGAGTISFHTTEQGPARLEIFSAHGRLVRSLLNQSLPSGYHDVSFNGRSDNGHRLGAGMYFVRLEVLGRVSTKKLVLLH